MSLFRLYTNRATRVVVFAAGEAQRMDANRIDTAHMLVALARDAAAPWAADEPSEDRLRRLPLVESAPLAMRVLGGLGITEDDLIAETCRVSGFTEPLRVSDSLSAEDCTTRLEPNRGIRSAVNVEMAFARSWGDKHLSTLHQLVGVFGARRAPAREILMNLGVSGVQMLKDAVRIADNESGEMNRRMHEFASTDTSLQRDIAGLMTATTMDTWWVRRKIRKTWPPPAPAADSS